MLATLTIPDEAALVQQLAALVPGSAWEGDSESALHSDELAVYTARPADPAQLAALLAYIWQGPMAGEWWDQTPVALIPGHLYVFSLDVTKSQRDDVPDAWSRAQAILSEGTPVRLTDRAGPGTAGTRKLAGVGPVLLAWRGPDRPPAARAPLATERQERYIAALTAELAATGYATDAESFLAGAGVNLDLPDRLIAVQAAALTSEAAGKLISALLRLRAVADAADRAA